MTARIPHGRNEHGFVIGSPQAAQFERMLEAQVRPGCEGKDLRSATDRAAKRKATLLARLVKPAWWDDLSEDPKTAGNRRFWARSMARKAARVLGVPVPEWVMNRASNRGPAPHSEEAEA